MNNSRKVLVSSVGDTDPYRNGYDGAICHILRKETEIKKVYLYFSKEMIRAEILNHRYTRAIKFLIPDIQIEIYPKTDKINEYLNLEYMKIDTEKVKEIDEYIKNEDKLIKDAHKFDLFYKEFYQILSDIRDNEEDCKSEILFNISSGTPAMKTSLLLIGILEAKKVTERKKYLNTHIVQVASPAKKSGKFIPHTVPKSENPEEYKKEDVEEIMTNLNENLSEKDLNDLGMTIEEMDRHSIEDNYKTTQIILYNDVKELFESCDYYGVRTLLKKYENILTDKLVLLGEHLGNRISGRVEEAEESSRKLNIFSELYPIQNRTEREIIEKFNVMRIKNRRDEINDWLLISTPLEERIYIKLLESIGIKMTDYTNGNYQRPKFDFSKLSIKHGSIYNKLERNLDVSKIRGKDINGRILQQIIECSEIAKNDVIIEKIRFLENSREIRNTAAHTISYVTREDIEKEIGSIKELESNFKFLIRAAYPQMNSDSFKDALDIYTKIENLILEEFEKNI